MSTTPQPFTFIWCAVFFDNHTILQPISDRYSNHDEDAEWNPSAFRDVLDYEETSPLRWFGLRYPDMEEGVYYPYALDIDTGEFQVNGNVLSLEDTPLSNRKLIFFRQVRQQFVDGVPQEPYVARYCLGYEGKNAEGKVEKKVIYIDG